MQAATAFSIGLPTDQTQQFLYALGLDVFPSGVSLGTGSSTAVPVPIPTQLLLRGLRLYQHQMLSRVCLGLRNQLGQG